MNQGASFRPSPELKAQRAISKAVGLLAELADWASRGEITIKHSSEPELGIIEEVLNISSAPDIETFFYSLGEALYQLRSSLDNFAFERAEASGVPIANPRTIYFPIVSDQTKWSERTRPLTTVSPQELSRWREIQPFTLAHPVESPLTILDRIQNGDKHRTPIVPQPLPATRGRVAFRLGEVLAHNEIDPTGMTIDFTESPELRDGEILARYRFGREVFILPESAADVTELSWFISDIPHGRVDLFLLIDALGSFIPEAFAFMRAGGRAPRHPVLVHTTGRDGTLKVFGRPELS